MLLEHIQPLPSSNYRIIIQSVEAVQKNNKQQVDQQAQKEARKKQRELELQDRAEKANLFKIYLSELPVLQYPNNYKVKCVHTHDDANRYLTELTSKNKEFGLDLEWPPVFVKGQQENKVALVQICSTDHIILIQLSRMKGFPSELRKFLERGDILKSGVNIRQDGLKMYRDYGIVTNGLVELSDMAEDSKASQLERVHLRSLRALTGLFLEQCMPKGKVRISNWANQNLTPTQIKYAANDAYASYKLYCVLTKLCNHPAKVKHLKDEHITAIIPKTPSPQATKSTQKPRNSNIFHPTSTTEVVKKNTS
ncbi:ribonuclease H-like protein [Backusella circina FSU 941]|nr:ribonuclease H-like protein [Backusella circina FSU 941]